MKILNLTDDQILEAMRPAIYRADGGYVFDTAKEDVIAAGRALISILEIENCDGLNAKLSINKALIISNGSANPFTYYENHIDVNLDGYTIYAPGAEKLESREFFKLDGNDWTYTGIAAEPQVKASIHVGELNPAERLALARGETK